MRLKMIVIRKMAVLLLLIMILISCNKANPQTDETVSLRTVLKEMESDSYMAQNIAEFIVGNLSHKGITQNIELPMYFFGVMYKYDVKGKYLFVYEIEYGGSASSYESINTYIFDTKDLEIISKQDILTDVYDSSFQSLILEYINTHENSDEISSEEVINCIDRLDFNMFYNNNGIGIKWNEFAIGPGSLGCVEIIIPYSRMQDYLTEVGKNIFQ